jgi:CubicO group peptidase (beta-lactamase class C family)
MKRIDLNHPNETVLCKERKMRFKLFILSILLSLALVAGSSVHAAQPASQEAGAPQLDAVVERALRRHNVPGASVAVLRDGAVAWAKGYGLADPVQGLPVMPDTVFDAASIAKPVTAWGIMKLVEEGLLDLDAPVEQYLTRWHLPPSRYNHDQVTLRRILSHTAGLSTDGDTGVEPGEYVPTLEEALNGDVLGMRALHVRRIYAARDSDRGGYRRTVRQLYAAGSPGPPGDERQQL